MSRIHLFVEDHAHEAFCRAIVERLAREAGAAPVITTVTARGGHGMVLTELTAWQRQHSGTTPGSLVVLIDANCVGWHAARSGVLERIDQSMFSSHVAGCPDPHVERWFMADPPSLRETLGAKVTLRKRKCERAIYKSQLVNALTAAGQVLTLDGIEFAQEIVEAMDLFRAGKNEPSLKHFIDGVKALVRGGG